ncbi:MAG: phage minor head protein [Caldilineaceae bacterium]
MPSRAETLLRNQLAMERAEASVARQVAAAYNQARRELLADLLTRWLGPGTLRPEEALDLARRLGLLHAIDARLLELEREAGAILRGVVVDAEERALEAIEREMALLPGSLRGNLRAFTRLNTAMVEHFVPIALSDVGMATTLLAGTLRRELQAGLLQGEAFPELAARLLNAEGSEWASRGATSAERLTRRLVIHAENAARSEYIKQAAVGIPELKRQAVAHVGGNTTETCLHVHGQIVGIDEPFDLGSYTPQFAQKMMHTPFHWNCRTAVAAWHPRFEAGGLNTANMQKSAQAEIKKRRAT